MCLIPRKRQQEQEVPRRVPVISGPYEFRHEAGHAEMKSIFQVLNTHIPGGIPRQGDLNAVVSATANKEANATRPPLIKPPRPPRHPGDSLPPSPKSVRTVLSSPNLRGEPQIMPQLRAVRSREFDSAANRRSGFSVKTEVIEGRRTAVRKVLDTMGCTKGEQFDIKDFKRVRPKDTPVEAFRRTSVIHNPRQSRVSFVWNTPTVPTRD